MGEKKKTKSNMYELFALGIKKPGYIHGEIAGFQYPRKDDAIKLNVWQHIAMSYDSSEKALRLYVDGQLIEKIDKVEPPLRNSKLPLVIGVRKRRKTEGSDDTQTIHPFAGFIDEVRVWSVARTQRQILDNMKGLWGSQQGLVAYYDFDHAKIMVPDVTANMNHCTFVGDVEIVNSDIRRSP